MTNKRTNISEIISDGKIFREENYQRYDFSGDVVDACVDSHRHADPFDLRISINVEILKQLGCLENISDRFKMSELDDTNVILAYLVSAFQYSIEEIRHLVKSENNYLHLVGVGLAIIHKCPELIPISNNEELYKYFRFCRINEYNLHCFISSEFLEFSFSKMLEEERVIYVWMIYNLTSLIVIDAIDVSAHFEFFAILLRNNDYPNETHKILYLKALEKCPNLINEILEKRFEIDPFTKQTNYSRWLIEIRMFGFVSVLRNSLPVEYKSDKVAKFDADILRFAEINKGDSCLMMA